MKIKNGFVDNASIKSAFCAGIIFLFYSCAKGPTENSIQLKPNILFISIDDLRPELGCYRNKYIHSPNIDRLAESGTLFKNHFVNVPTCGASRFSLITGMLPRTTAHLSNQIIADSLANRPESDRPESFIHQLRRNGYYTLGIGKISHMPDGFVYGYQEPVSDIREMPHSWDEFLFDHGEWGSGHNAFFGYADGNNRNDLKKQVLPYEAAQVEDDGYPDGLTTNLAISKIGELKNKKEPFFMAVGFFKPHLPFNAPKKYWDLYNPKNIPLSPTPNLPVNTHKASLHSSGEFNQYALGPEKASLDTNLSDEYARNLKHAYYACISYIDAQIGRLIHTLEEQGLSDKTIIVIWGDHGWHLGDQRVWGKHTLNDRSLKSALIIKMPDQETAKIVQNPVSTIDLYPTILDLAHTPPQQTDGHSLLPLIKNSNTKWNYPAYSYYRKGISMRTEDYRLTKYYRTQLPNQELYDLKKDPYEMKNIAETNPAIVANLLAQFDKGDTGLFKK